MGLKEVRVRRAEITGSNTLHRFDGGVPNIVEVFTPLAIQMALAGVRLRSTRRRLH